MEFREKKEILSREELKNKKRRRAKARAAVITVLLLAVVTIVLAILLKTTLFPIETVSVTGNETVTSEQILEASGISQGDKLFSISKSQINKKLTVKYPYIKKIEFKYPSLKELKIVITETKDVFCYKIGTSYFTADEENKILSKNSQQPENTVLIITKTKNVPECGYRFELETDEFDIATDIYKYLTRVGIGVNSIDVSDSNYLSLKIKNRFIVSLGSITDLQGKLEHLRGMLPQIDAKNGSDITGEINLQAWSSSKREGFFTPKTLQ